MKKDASVKIKAALPYILTALFCTNFGRAWRTAETGLNAGEHLMNFMNALPSCLQRIIPSFYPFDLAVGAACGLALWAAVYLKSQNEKKYRKGMEYGSARWGTHKDIEPFMDSDFKNNVILTKTELLTMNSRPSNPATARNKNVLIIGGSGSGKTRFWLKPNLLQCHSSYVVTDPKRAVF